MDKDRKTAFDILKSVEKDGSWSNLAIGKHAKDVVSAAFVRELVYGVLRNQFLLNYQVNRFLKNPHIGISERILLSMGFYQMAFMESVPDHAAIDETVEIASVVIKGKKGFINAVLRSFQRDGKRILFPDDSIEKLCVEYSTSKWIVDLWLEAYGKDKTINLLSASCTKSPLVIRVNTTKTSRDDLSLVLQQQGFEVFKCKESRLGLIINGSGLLETEEYKLGFFSVQGEASQLDVLELNPLEGERVLDLCSAPGGKTCAMAELMKDNGSILSCDIYEERLKLVETGAKRLGLKSISTMLWDGTKDNSAWHGKFDAVLCDVPCTGLGTLRQKPELKLKDKDQNFELLPSIQYQILKNGAAYLKENGRLMYSTCTVNQKENKQQIIKFLDENPGFTLLGERQFFQEEDGPDGFYFCLLKKHD